MQLLLSLIATIAVGYILVTDVLNEHYPEKSVYQNAEYRFNPARGVRSSEFVIKGADNKFLIAPNPPKELRPRIELLDAGRYTAKVEAQYPDWLCGPNDFDRANVLIQGGSLNERVKLLRHSPKEFSFTAAAGQDVTLRVRNSRNKECGRALVKFYKDNNSTPVRFGLLLVWTLVLALCLLSRSSPLIVLLGVIANTLLIAAEASLAPLTTTTVVVNTGIAILITGLLFLVSAIAFRSRVIAFMATLAVLIMFIPALAFIAYDAVFSVPFSIEAVHGAFQSYGSQALEFWQQYVGKKRTLYLLVAIAILFLSLRQVNSGQAHRSKALVYSLLLLLTGSALLVDRLHQSGIYNLVLKSAIVYRWEIEAFQKVAGARAEFTAEATRKTEHTQDTAVFVFGESVNKKQMSAYGYVRETTPLLDRRIAAGEVALFTNAYSSHTHSNPTMSLILTQASQYGGKRWQESPSVFNYMKAADATSHWLTNHRLLGGWSNHITTIIREADHLKTINYKIGYGLDSTHFDPALVPLYKEALAERPNQLTMLHMYNSHSFYCNRYPKDFSQFNDRLSEAEYGKMHHIKRAADRMVNCYDNTIYYADMVLEQLIGELEDRESPSVLLYVADHGEEFLDDRTHNSAVFTFDMINIPLFVWANEAWREKHAQVWQTLNENKDKLITNDLMFETILGLSGITAPSINTKNDISNTAYEEPAEPKTLHGRVAINHPNNWNYWQTQNLRYANDADVEVEVVDVESVGEAKRALALGVRRLRLNVGVTETGLMLVSKKDQDIIIPVDVLLASLDAPKLESISLVMNSEGIETEVDRLSDLITELQLETKIKLVRGLPSEREPISLASADFVARIENMKKAGNFSSAAPIPVFLSSRYTLPPPEPN